MVLLRKIKTLVSNPRDAVQGYINRYTHYRRAIPQGQAERHFERLGYANLLAGRPATAIRPDWVDLWFLYQTVRCRKPEVILEFGGGCSTVILAQALLDNGREHAPTGHLYSVDADPYWAEVTRRTLPDHLGEVCTVLYSPLQEMERSGVAGFLHADVPAVMPNFLYLDGPTLTPEREVAFDVLYIEPALPADFFMVVDGRTVQSQFLAHHLTRRYRIQTDTVHFRTVFELLP